MIGSFEMASTGLVLSPLVGNLVCYDIVFLVIIIPWAGMVIFNERIVCYYRERETCT